MNSQTRRELLNVGFYIPDINRHWGHLSQFFERDEARRFEILGPISGGQYSVTWKLKYRETPTSNVRYIVLKTDRKYSEYGSDNGAQDDDDDNDEDEEMDDDDDLDLLAPASQTPNEKEHLRALRWAKHIVSPVEIPNDPLARDFPDVFPHNMDPDSWLYVEYLENGTISQLIEKAKQKRTTIPNRILWRFFMCLIRMVIDMGWPPAAPGEEDAKSTEELLRSPPYGGLMHGDMHEGNIMLGYMGPNDLGFEHRLTPILQLIDLGSMWKAPQSRDSNIEAVRNNLFDIGLVMLSLIARNEELGQSIVPQEETAKPIRVRAGQISILTNATPLLAGDNGVTPFPWVDPDLRTAVCACLATHPHQRPSVASLFRVVGKCIRERDQQYYAARYGDDGATESNRHVRGVIQTLVFDA